MIPKSILEVALLELGHKTFPGQSTNPEVLKYYAETGHAWVNDDETPWCAAFLNWVVQKAGYKQTKKLTARSFLYWGSKTQEPELGDVVVFWRESPTSWKGHCGVYIKELGGRIFVLGGNQNNEVNITSFPKGQVLGYRRRPSIIQDLVSKLA